MKASFKQYVQTSCKHKDYNSPMFLVDMKDLACIRSLESGM